jgi:hypothetical protein
MGRINEGGVVVPPFGADGRDRGPNTAQQDEKKHRMDGNRPLKAQEARLFLSKKLMSARDAELTVHTNSQSSSDDIVLVPSGPRI